MPSDVSRSCTLALRDGVGDQIASVFTAEGYSDADERVWAKSARSDTSYPYAVYNVREQPSILMGNKDDDPVRGIVTINVYGQDDVTTDELGGAIQETLVDESNKPTVTGFRVVWHDLLFNEPLDDVRPDAQNIYGRVMEIEYHLDPTS
jgi:hypothetical protein